MLYVCLLLPSAKNKLTNVMMFDKRLMKTLHLLLEGEETSKMKKDRHMGARRGWQGGIFTTLDFGNVLTVLIILVFGNKWLCMAIKMTLKM